MKYFLDDVKLPLNAEDKDIKVLIRDRLGLRNKSFRYEILKKKVEYEPYLHSSHLCFAFAVETSEFVRNTSIAFLNEQEQENKDYGYAQGPVVISSDLSGLFFAYFLVKRKASPILLCEEDAFCKKGRNQGGFLYFEDAQKDAEVREMFNLFLKEGAPLPGEMKYVSPLEYASMVDALISFIERRGATIYYNAKPLYASNILGRFRKLIYEVKGEQRELKARHVIMVDQGKSASFYSAIKAKKTKSDIRLRFFLEGRSRDCDPILYGGKPNLPTALIREEKDKGESHSLFLFPFPSVSLKNYSISANANEPDICFRVNSKSSNSIGIIEISLGGNLELMRSIVASLKRLNLPKSIPCQRLEDYLIKKETLRLGLVKSAYSDGIYMDNLYALLPKDVAEAFRLRLLDLKKNYPLFGKDAILTGALCRRLPGQVVIPKSLAGFVCAYWNQNALDIDLVGTSEFAFASCQEFLRS